jgi:hypothetical protein
MDSYNLALHIGAIFIMMAVSIAGFCIPHLLVASSAKNSVCCRPLDRMHALLMRLVGHAAEPSASMPGR